ncbi:MAG: peptidase S9 [Rhodothalassiaceae bacterium]|nr:MAG: peptidase S9 [Rhodothalassiaceae bacterium]
MIGRAGLERALRRAPAAVLAVALGTGAAAAADEKTQDWPYPQDIPAPTVARPGLAGTLPVDIERFLLVRGIGQAALAPDGKTLAVTARITGVPQLWTVPATGGWPQQLTFAPGGITEHHWAPDGARILYAADRDGDEREAFYLISRDGRRERVALAHDGAFRAFGAFAPDGRRFLYSSTKRNGTDFDIHLADLETGGTRLVHEGRFGWYASSWQPQGTRVLVSETRGEDGNDLHLLDAATGRLETLFAPADPASFSGFAWLPDGSGFFMATNLDRDFAGLAFFDLKSRRLSWIATPGRDVEDVALLAGGRYLAWTENDGGFSRLVVEDRESRRRLAVPKELPAGIYALSGGAGSARLAITVRSPKIPGDVWVWDLADGRLWRATHSTLAGIDPDTLVMPESVFFESSDGLRLHGLLYLPRAGAADAKPPVVVRVHGGPTAQARPGFDPLIQYLVGRGIAVFDLNFRGSTGFGRRFARADNGRERPKAVRDVAEAVAFLRRDGRVDADRAAVMGGSYGGFLVNAVMGMHPGVYKAGVSFVGVSDWVRALEEASPALKASDRLEYGDITDPDWRAFFAEISPIRYVDRIRAPMLFSHGANDPRDPVTESDRMVRALRANGVPVTYLRFADEGHGVRRLGNRVTLYRAVAAFLEEHLVKEPER